MTLKYEGFDILSNIYEKKGEMQKALNYKVKYSQLKDSLFLKEVEGEYNRLRKLLDLDRVKLAEKDEEIYEVNQILSEAQRTNYLLVALCISLIIAVFLVRVKYRK